MMKKTKTIGAILLASATLLGATACGGGKEEEDPTKTYLDVGVFNAGLGTAYFDELKKDFEAYYANEHFETGKTGVVVRPLKKNTEFNPDNLENSMKNLDPVMYILDQGNYEKFTAKKLFGDVTDVMTEKYLDEDGNIAADTGKEATQSVEDTMLEGYSDVFKKDGKYYAVPYMLSIPGIIYDADLFNEASLYFKKDGSIGANAEMVAAGDCSAGPDGKWGTSDDGLPDTWNDFLKLLEEIRLNYTPFTWAVSPSTYQISRAFNAIWANYEGYDNFMLNYSFKGKDSALGEINENNFTKLLQQEGRKAAIKAFYDITSISENYSDRARPGAQNTHTSAQREYIQSYRGLGGGKRIAMFVENSYWEQEAREDVFNKEPSQYGYGKRNFRYLPIPRFENVAGIKDQKNTQRVLPAAYAESYICLSAQNSNKNAEVQTKVAKLFIKFMQQRSQLVKYTANTGCIRPYNYTITPEEKAICTPYMQSILTFIEEGAKVAPNLAIATKRRLYTGETGFNESNNGFAFVAKVGDATVKEPFTYFFNYNLKNNQGKTVNDAFEDMKNTITGILKAAGAI